MSTRLGSVDDSSPLHIAITRRAKPEFEAEFQQALRELSLIHI